MDAEKFPFRELNQTEQLNVIKFCGGTPLEADYVRGFLSISGRPLVDFYPVAMAMIKARKANIALDYLDENQGRQAFNQGAYLYAGMLSVVSGIETLPWNSTVLNRVCGEMDDLAIVLAAREQAAKIPSFAGVMETVRPVLMGDNEALYRASILGAGTLQLIMIESLRAQADLAQLEASSGLEGLDLIFSDIERGYLG